MMSATEGEDREGNVVRRLHEIYTRNQFQMRIRGEEDEKCENFAYVINGRS